MATKTKAQIPILDAKMEVTDEIQIVLTSNSKAYVDVVGEEKVMVAMMAAAGAVMDALKKSLWDLGLVKTGTTLRSVDVLGVPSPFLTVVGFRGRRNIQRTNAQVAKFLDDMFGLVEYSGFEAAAKTAWRSALAKR